MAAGLVLGADADPAVRVAASAGFGTILAAGQLLLSRMAGPSQSPVGGVFAGTSGQARRYLEERVAEAADPADRWQRLTHALGELLGEAAGLEQVKLYSFEDDSGQLIASVVEAGAEHPVVIPLDPRVRTWLTVNSQPLSAANLDDAKLGGLRRPIEDLVNTVGGAVILPLVYYDRLVGIVTGQGAWRRAMRRGGADILDVQRDAAGALGELRLRAEAEEQAGVAAEVAEAAQHQQLDIGTSVEEQAGCRIAQHYAPAHQFSGAWWNACQLPDGRLFAAIGEVTGHGVAAALLSATAVGVCESARATMGAAMAIDGLIVLLHDAVQRTARGSFGMSCFALIVDREAGSVTFGSAGHPFPYLCSPAADKAGRGVLSSLVARGPLLGGVEAPVISLGTRKIARGDTIVLHTASLTNAQNDDGDTFGERRLQHFLRRTGLIGATSPDGSQLAEQIGTDLTEFLDGRPLDDDVIVATIEVLP